MERSVLETADVGTAVRRVPVKEEKASVVVVVMAMQRKAIYNKQTWLVRKETRKERTHSHAETVGRDGGEQNRTARLLDRGGK